MYIPYNKYSSIYVTEQEKGCWKEYLSELKLSNYINSGTWLASETNPKYILWLLSNCKVLTKHIYIQYSNKQDRVIEPLVETIAKQKLNERVSIPRSSLVFCC